VYSLPAAGDGGGYGGGWLYPAKRANTRSNGTKLVRLIRKKIYGCFAAKLKYIEGK